LRGELRSEKAAPVGVEFALRRLAEGDGSKVLGVVRFLTTSNSRFAANTVTGEIRNHTMTLRETGGAWTMGRIPQSVGRAFVIHLPTEPTNAEITGTWSFGLQSGTLALKVAPPW
jgi:hypothetical protein